MHSTARFLLLIGAMLTAPLLVAQQAGMIRPVTLPGCGVTTILCWIVCYGFPLSAIGLLAWTGHRIGRSISCQRTWTRQALQPLLDLPIVTPPPALAGVLAELHLTECTRVVSLEAPVALCHGFFRPRLLLSTGVVHRLSRTEIEAVLRHEQAHLRRRDPLRLLGVRALADALPSVAALRQLAATLPLAQELAANRDALAAVGAEAVAGALLKVGGALGPLRNVDAPIMAFGAVDARIDQLLGEPPPPLASSLAIAVSVMALLILSPFLCGWSALLWFRILRVSGHHAVFTRLHTGD